MSCNYQLTLTFKKNTLTETLEIEIFCYSTDVASEKYAISAANDGILFGNTVELRVFNSLCLTCQVDQCDHKVWSQDRIF